MLLRMETDSINFNDLISMLNEFALKAKSQGFIFVDEIPSLLAEDLMNSLYGKTIATRDKKIIYYVDIKNWLDIVWHNGFTFIGNTNDTL